LEGSGACCEERLDALMVAVESILVFVLLRGRELRDWHRARCVIASKVVSDGD